MRFWKRSIVESPQFFDDSLVDIAASAIPTGGREPAGTTCSSFYELDFLAIFLGIVTSWVALILLREALSQAYFLLNILF